MMEDFSGGAHAAAGLSCHDCHGGNPDPAVADDMMAAMDEGWGENPYVGTPDARRHSGLLWSLSFGPHLHEALQARRPGRSGARVLDQPSRHSAPGRGSQRRHLHRLSWRSRHPGGRQSRLYWSSRRRSAETCRDCHGDAGANEWLPVAQRTTAADRSVRPLETERPCRRISWSRRISRPRPATTATATMARLHLVSTR